MAVILPERTKRTIGGATFPTACLIVNIHEAPIPLLSHPRRGFRLCTVRVELLLNRCLPF